MTTKYILIALKTDKESQIVFALDNREFMLFSFFHNYDLPKQHSCHLYILSNEKPQVNDYTIDMDGMRKVSKVIPGNQYIGKDEIPVNLLWDECWKVVASTDVNIQYTDELTSRGLFERLERPLGLNKANYKPSSVGNISEKFVKLCLEKLNKNNKFEPILHLKRLENKENNHLEFSILEEVMFTWEQAKEIAHQSAILGYENYNANVRHETKLIDDWFVKTYPKEV